MQDIFWDGPASADEFFSNWAVVVEEVAQLKRHYFVISLTESSVPIGCCQVSPDARFFRAEIGLWVGAPHQGRGFGTAIIRDLASYAFDMLHVHKLDAEIFVGNWRSRTAFEKNGFAVEGTIRAAVLKLGVPRDVWHMGLLNPRSRLSGGVDTNDGVSG